MPATGDRITQRKDRLFQGMYTAQTPDDPKRKYVYGRKKRTWNGSSPRRWAMRPAGSSWTTRTSRSDSISTASSKTCSVAL